MIMFLALLLACGDAPSGDSTHAVNPNEPTVVDPTAIDPTTGEVIETYTMELKIVAAEAMPVVITGSEVRCTDDEATIAIETTGSPRSIDVVPWLDGAAGDPIDVAPIDSPDTLRIHSHAVQTPDCGQITWQFLVASDTDVVCLIHGPDAQSVSTAVGDCKAR